MKIYCFYGIGTPTERSYYYAVTDESVEEECSGTTNGTGCTHIHQSEHQTASSTTEKTVHSVKHPNLVYTYKSSQMLLYLTHLKSCLFIIVY